MPTTIDSLPNQVSGDPTGTSIINAESFAVVVSVYDDSGNPAVDVSVVVYASGSPIGSALTNYLGQATIQCKALRGVSGTSSGRDITVSSEYGQTSVSIPLWFPVTMTVECPYATVSQPEGYTQTTACGPQPDGKAFVALPAPLTCGTEVLVKSTVTGTHISVPVDDVGPYLTDNPYWNGSGVPANTENNDAGLDASDGTWNALGLSGDFGCSYSNPFGNTGVLWRFS